MPIFHHKNFKCILLSNIRILLLNVHGKILELNGWPRFFMVTCHKHFTHNFQGLVIQHVHRAQPDKECPLLENCKRCLYFKIEIVY